MENFFKSLNLTWREAEGAPDFPLVVNPVVLYEFGDGDTLSEEDLNLPPNV